MSYQASSTNRLLKRYHSAFVLPFNESGNQTYDLKWYFGPNKYKLLRKYKIGLERQIPLGWGFFLMHWINRFAVIPVFNWLEGWSINYGIIILILTILLKIVLFPIAWKTYISSAKMRILKPEIEEINARYPKKEEAMKKQQATMALYKRAGVNPMAGCVPMLLQFPILIAMFRFFPSAFELRQQPFLWAHDLSSYDSIWNLPFTIPFYGDHVSLFTLLMTISTIIYTKINNDMMGSTNQLPGMKTMMYLMPIMFLGFFNDYSSGLSYYYLLANLLTFAQMYIIRRFVDEDKLHKRIQENKAKPVKKSSWQKRLEEATRQHTSRKK
jgi:YidC/Oxa1 family membrane protein insertase